jgi:hypothetical protein
MDIVVWLGVKYELCNIGFKNQELQGLGVREDKCLGYMLEGLWTTRLHGRVIVIRV